MEDKDTNRYFFGAKGCLILICALLSSYVLLVISLNTALSAIQASELWGEISEAELAISRRVVLSVLTPLMLVIVSLLVLKKYFPREPLSALARRFGFDEGSRPALLPLSFLFGVALILAVKVLISIYPPDSSVRELPSAIVSEAELWQEIVFSLNLITIVPIAEEFVFRGILYKGFSNSWNKFGSALIVCAIFAIGHADAFATGYWINQSTILVISMVFVAAREISGALYSPILIHSGFNFGSIFITYNTP